MKIPFLELSRNNESQLDALTSIIRSVVKKGNFILGEQVEEFEKVFAHYIGSKYCLGVGNGLNALELSIKSLELPKDSEIIVPSNTFYASVLSITNCGHKPIFVEPNIDTFNINTERIESKITNNTKAILVVHLYGLMADMTPIITIAKKYKLKIIEDVAQAVGAELDGVKAGNFGDVAAFSFYPTKNLGAFGDAGAVTTNNIALYRKIQMMRNYGFEKKDYAAIEGTNSRMDEIQAAILNHKIKTLPSENEKRSAIAKLYNTNIKNDYIKLPTANYSKNHVWHLYTIQTKHRSALIQYLNKYGISTAIHYPVAPHKQKAFERFNNLHLPIAEKMQDELLSIPLHPFLSDKEIEYIITYISTFSI